jgi:Uma2 family endonuclease
MLISANVKQNGLGAVYHGPVDVRLTKFDVVVPDLMFLRADRRYLYTGRQAVDGAPDLIVEVLSPSTRSRDLTTKMDLYAQSGVLEYWVVDPATSGVTIYNRTSFGSFEEIPVVGGVIRSQVLGGMNVAVAEVFPSENDS